jgi:zinc/manganese transport system permease protein
MTAASIYGFSIFFAPSGLVRRHFPRPHLKG